MKTRKPLYIIIQLIIGLGLLTFLFTWVDFDLRKITSILSRIPFLTLVFCFVIYLLTYILRVLRFQVLLDWQVESKKLFSIVAVHNLFNFILPARIGEVSYIYLIGKEGKIPAGVGTGSLLIVRIFDLISFILLLAVSITLSRHSFPVPPGQINIIIFLILLALILLVSLLFWGEKIVLLFKGIFKWRKLKRFKVSDYIARKLSELRETFKNIKSLRAILSLLIMSVAMIFIIRFVDYLLLHSMGISLNFWETIVAMSFTFLTIFLPIQGIGNLGTFEGAFLIGLLIFDVPKELAITVGFGLHLIGYLFLALIGGYGLITLKLWR